MGKPANLPGVAVCAARGPVLGPGLLDVMLPQVFDPGLGLAATTPLAVHVTFWTVTSLP